MLCETIHLYRLKQMLHEEEELYFLLIDIMRSPQIFKAICGDSIKHPVEKGNGNEDSDGGGNDKKAPGSRKISVMNQSKNSRFISMKIRSQRGSEKNTQGGKQKIE